MASWLDTRSAGATTLQAGTEPQPVGLTAGRVRRVPPSSIHHLLWNAA